MVSCRERVVNTHQKLEAMIPGLQPSMTYQFRVVALNPRGPGMSSEVLQVTTNIEVCSGFQKVFANILLICLIVFFTINLL